MDWHLCGKNQRNYFEKQPAIVYVTGGEIRRVPASSGNPDIFEGI
jgi:hypothetical protein